VLLHGHPRTRTTWYQVAADVVALMLALGYQRFAIVGHDRGSYVAYRTALDHPRRR
jgi:haloacetate dehalogenase